MLQLVLKLLVATNLMMRRVLRRSDVIKCGDIKRLCTNYFSKTGADMSNKGSVSDASGGSMDVRGKKRALKEALENELAETTKTQLLQLKLSNFKNTDCNKTSLLLKPVERDAALDLRHDMYENLIGKQEARLKAESELAIALQELSEFRTQEHDFF